MLVTFLNKKRIHFVNFIPAKKKQSWKKHRRGIIAIRGSLFFLSSFNKLVSLSPFYFIIIILKFTRKNIFINYYNAVVGDQ